MSAIRKLPFVVVTAALAASGCATTRTVSFTSPAAAGRSFVNVAVFAMTPDRALRQTAETIFTASVGGASRATPSHTFVFADELGDAERVVTKVRTGRYDGVVVFRVGAIRATSNIREHPDGLVLYSAPGGFGAYWGAYSVGPVGDRLTATDRTVEIEATLYDAADGTLVWAAQSSFPDPGSTLKLIETAVKAAAADLRKQKLLR